MAFRRRAKRPVTLVVVGLGNPGREYSGTRHNVGFMTLDLLAKRLGVRFDHREARAQVAEAPGPGDTSTSILLAKPQTFMNLSGESAGPLLKKCGLGANDMWVVYDELDLPFGRLRIRRSGGAGGHNGVASLIERVGTNHFPRFRVGIGRPDEPDPVDHLLSPFTDEERERLPALLELAADAVEAGLEEGLEASMNRFNGRTV